MVANLRLRKFLIALTLLVVPAAASAQLNSNPAQVMLNAETFPESLELQTTTPLVQFSISPYAVSDGDQPIIVMVNHVLHPSSGTRPIDVYFYFGVDEALTNGASAILSNRVQGSIGGLPYQTFGSPTPFSGPTGIKLPTNGMGSSFFQTDLSLRIDAMGLALLPGTYSGTLFIQAQAL